MLIEYLHAHFIAAMAESNQEGLRKCAYDREVYHRYDMALTYSVMPKGPSLLTWDFSVDAPGESIMLYSLPYEEACERYASLGRYTSEWCRRQPRLFYRHEDTHASWRWPWYKAKFIPKLPGGSDALLLERFMQEYRRDVQFEFACAAHRLREQYSTTGLMECGVFRLIAQFADLDPRKPIKSRTQ